VQENKIKTNTFKMLRNSKHFIWVNQLQDSWPKPKWYACWWKSAALLNHWKTSFHFWTVAKKFHCPKILRNRSFTFIPVQTGPWSSTKIFVFQSFSCISAPARKHECKSFRMLISVIEEVLESSLTAFLMNGQTFEVLFIWRINLSKPLRKHFKDSFI
jgi:hypothetical protein